jgi:hypothetical protein
MLSLALRDDQKAKNEAVFSYQFSYQLASRTRRNVSNFSPVQLGSGPRDREFESRLADQFFKWARGVSKGGGLH